MNQVVIGIGSNIDPVESIKKAKELIAETHTLLDESTVIETEPVGFLNQPSFLNCAILINTKLDKAELKNWLKILEKKLGRTSTENRFGPRTIDLDIVVWNGQIADNDFYEREFLRNAVLEILPDIEY